LESPFQLGKAGIEGNFGSMLNSATALRRWLGVFCLAMASGMLIWGQTLLQPHLQGWVFLVYWLVFLVFTCATVAISLLDFFAVRRLLMEDIADLKAKALKEIETPPKRGHVRTGSQDSLQP
jgi:hypothetical protein